jgi:hypothetical protein
VADPILCATTASGEVWDDPSEDALFMFMEDLKTPGSSLLVERVEPEREQEWARVTRNEHGLFEYENSLHHRYVSSLRPVHEFLTRWAFDLVSPDEES